MNKKISLFMLLALTALLVACGGTAAVDTSALDAAQAEVTALMSRVDDAEGALAEANAKIEELGSMGSEVETVTQEVAVQFAGGGDTLGAVQARGTLNCAVSGSLVGFSFLNSDNEMVGFDADYCRAMAAAVLGDKDAVEFTPTTGTSRFPTLQSGEVDMLSRNTTWTFSRDTSLGFEFAPVTFYDGQGMMVRADSGIDSLAGLEGGSVCVQAGTTTEKNLADVFRALDIEIESQVYPDQTATTTAFQEGLCDGYTTDKSALASNRGTFDNPNDYTILAATMSKEPLGPLVRHGDNNWGDILRWVVNCTINAEEFGITSANVDDFLGSDDPGHLNLLGVEGELGSAMGLNNDFCYQVIAQVGNYGEMYDQHIVPIGLERGVNALWTDGGLLYAPPFR